MAGSAFKGACHSIFIVEKENITAEMLSNRMDYWQN